MNKVERLSDFPSGAYIQQFFGKTFNEAVSEANKNGTFISYYEQKFSGKNKSILVSYKEEKDGNE